MRKLPAVAIILLFTSCASGPSHSRTPLDFSSSRLIDLTHSFDEQTIYWPTSPSSFELRRLHYGPTDAGFFYASNVLCTPEHGGTHLDAPIHFAKGAWTADQIPLERFIAPAFVIDVRDKTDGNADYRLTAVDVLEWETRNGRIPSGGVVILRTGWSARWPDRKRYLGDDTPGVASNLHFPSFGEDAARLLVNERHVGMLGVDTASIDYGPSTDFIVHQIANGANVPALENLTNLDLLPERGAWIIALPMKIKGGSGGPARVVAVLSE